MPTKRLPNQADITHLKHQARDLLRSYRRQAPDTLQRIREFHPRFTGSGDQAIAARTFTLSDAQLTIAREYGIASWQRLRTVVAEQIGEKLQLLHHERIDDHLFRQAVDLLDEGNPDQLRDHLATHPDLIERRVAFEGENYFTRPMLLEFIAENPIRHAQLPANIVEMATVILEAGAAANRESVTAALQLVSSGRIARECGAQVPLIDLLCDHGGDPGDAMMAALSHGEFSAVDALIRRGAPVDLVAAAAMGRHEEASQLYAPASPEERHRALALAAQHGQAGIVKLLLDKGENPNRFNPEGCHSHSTPLHQAALAGWTDVVRVLIEAGARPDIEDIHFQATALGWARHAGNEEIADYLQAVQNTP